MITKIMTSRKSASDAIEKILAFPEVVKQITTIHFDMAVMSREKSIIGKEYLFGTFYIFKGDRVYSYLINNNNDFVWAMKFMKKFVAGKEY